MKQINIIAAHCMQNNSDYYSGEYEIGIHRKGVKKIPYSCGRVRNFLTPTPECQIGQWKNISFFFYNFSICISKDPEWSKSFQHLKVHRTYDENRLKWIYFTKCFIKMHNIYFRFWTFCIFFSLKNYFGCGQWIPPPPPVYGHVRNFLVFVVTPSLNDTLKNYIFPWILFILLVSSLVSVSDKVNNIYIFWIVNYRHFGGS